jgi:hypothetical protein
MNHEKRVGYAILNPDKIKVQLYRVKVYYKSVTGSKLVGGTLFFANSIEEAAIAIFRFIEKYVSQISNTETVSRVMLTEEYFGEIENDGRVPDCYQPIFDSDSMIGKSETFVYENFKQKIFGIFGEYYDTVEKIKSLIVKREFGVGNFDLLSEEIGSLNKTLKQSFGVIFSRGTFQT